jgi:hydroxylamine reductase (hybrid-cluster protein)
MFQFPVFCADGKIYTCCENKGNPNFAIGNWDQDDFRDIWLKDRHMEVYNTTNTNSHNNNTFNINFYGEATDTHILEKQLKGMIRRCLNYESDYESASELTIDYCNSMYSVEENKNIDIKDQRSKYGKVLTSKGKKYIAVKKIIATVLNTTAAKLKSRLNILKENNPEGFDDPMKRIYNEIKNMEEDGLMHFYSRQERKELYDNLLLIFTEKEEDEVDSSDDE